MRRAIVILCISSFLAGCGSNFEWFPKSSTFSNSSTASSGTTSPVTSNVGTVAKTLPFPSGVSWVSDLAFNKSSGSFWLLAGTNTAPTTLVKMNATSGAFEGEVALDPSLGNIVEGSSLAFNGSTFWITSNALNNSVPVSEIYQLAASGLHLFTYRCPATSTGFCQGLVWDATTSSFWAAGSDTRGLANFQLLSGAVTSEQLYANLWSSNGVTDIGFDSSVNQLLVVKNAVIPVNAASGAESSTINLTVPGQGRGDWDGSHFWFIDNAEKKLKAVVVR